MISFSRYFVSFVTFVIWTMSLITAIQSNIKISSSLQFYDSLFLGPSPIWSTDVMVLHATHLIRTYHQLTKGKELIPIHILDNDPKEAARQLFYLPHRVVVSHGIQTNGDGPILNYGNEAALKRWSVNWEELTTMPSKYTAESMEQSERQTFLNQVLSTGIVENYSGIRIGKNQQRFRILDGTVWNVNNLDTSIRIGQAATFSAWEDLPV